MAKHRGFLRWWQISWPNEPIDHPAGVRTAYARYETVWADAWPSLDDWFKAGVMWRERSRNRPL